MTGNIRLRRDGNAAEVAGDPEVTHTVIDNAGYNWHFGPNESKALPDDGNRTTLASNATVKWGTTTQQAEAPGVIADIDDQIGRS
jgi:hypothetical protein